MGKQKRSRQKFHNAAVKPKGDKKQDEDSAMEVRKINILFYILKCGCNNSMVTWDQNKVPDLQHFYSNCFYWYSLTLYKYYG